MKGRGPKTNQPSISVNRLCYAMYVHPLSVCESAARAQGETGVTPLPPPPGLDWQNMLAWKSDGGCDDDDDDDNNNNNNNNNINNNQQMRNEMHSAWLQFVTAMLTLSHSHSVLTLSVHLPRNTRLGCVCVCKRVSGTRSLIGSSAAFPTCHGDGRLLFSSLF